MNYKDIVSKLGFAPKENTSGIFQKKYSNCDDYTIEIDFENEKFNYGNLIISENETTQNFSQKENFVVLECVNRLLEKGYQPKNIILEKTWATGHGTSGRLDIIVTRDDESKSTYLMIECKTWGSEFDREFSKLNKNGGQLFTYFQQDKDATVLMLYTSKLDDNETKYKNEIIKIEEDYRQTGNVKDFFDRWNKLSKANGIFDSWVKPYEFQSKALTPESLKEIKQEDSSFIFNRFLEILRHNVVSDKPNAFNKIFTLFLCKIYDETTTKPNAELGFQWKEGIDDNISFQKRLTDLYREGMKRFLEKNVTDVSDSEFDEQFQEKIADEDRRKIKEILTDIRVIKNNVFAIKEVLDDGSFDEHAKVVKEVVELLQNYQIRYTKKQQYLSDFFELLLTTGFKQESGQFFTPIPIAQFIIKSLPIKDMVIEKLNKSVKGELLPIIIDYAAGSGHFITESMHEIQQIINTINPDDFISDTSRKIKSWSVDHFNWAFDYIYGIEKDYRLVKVGKVGCYLHGDGLANIIHSDGLGNFENTKEYNNKLNYTDKDFPKENKQFDIVISNPPYSISAFKNSARKFYTEKDFELYDYLTDQSSEIECLFIERTKQLLKDDGIAGIILPTSILSNSGIYTKAREMIIKYFDIIAITKLGSNTFMATGTNTIILFLKRRSNYTFKRIIESINQFTTNLRDITINKIENPISKYIAHTWNEITFEDYITLLQKNPNDNIKQEEIYQEYIKKIKAKTEREKKERWNKIIELEKEKLLYFILSYPQKIVLVKTGEKKEEKQFLGYEFSNRRGSEGIHPIQRGKTIDECTHLFDTNCFENPEKASTYIYKALQSNLKTGKTEIIEIHKSLQKNISYIDLVDMMTFDRVNFEKTISLKKKVMIESKWKLVKISKLCKIGRGRIISRKYIEKNKGNYPVYSSQTLNDGIFGRINTYDFEGEYVTWTTDGIYAGTCTYRIGKFNCTNVCGILEAKTKKINMIFLPYILNQITPEYVVKVANPKLMNNVMAEIKIPLPPKEVQEKIVSEIEVLEEKEKKSKEEIANFRKEINNIVDDIFTKSYKKEQLGNITEIKNGGTPSTNNPEYWNGGINWATLVDTKNKFLTQTVRTISKKGMKNSSAVLLPVNTVVFSSRATIGDVSIAKIETCTNQGYKNFICNPQIIDYEFLYYILKHEANNIENLASGMTYKEISKTLISEYKIPLPSLEEQKEIVAKIEKIEQAIENLENEIKTISQEKESILKKYLE